MVMIKKIDVDSSQISILSDSEIKEASLLKDKKPVDPSSTKSDKKTT